MWPLGNLLPNFHKVLWKGDGWPWGFEKTIAFGELAKSLHELLEAIFPRQIYLVSINILVRTNILLFHVFKQASDIQHPARLKMLVWTLLQMEELAARWLRMKQGSELKVDSNTMTTLHIHRNHMKSRLANANMTQWNKT